MIRSRGAAAASLAAFALVSGCSAAPDAGAAADAAEAFAAAVGASDGATACGLLAPAAVRALESDAQEACEEAVLAPDVVEEVADGGGAVEARAYGRQAQVRLDGDTVFLTLDGDAWLVTAAGCTPREAEPYDCAVEGS